MGRVLFFIILNTKRRRLIIACLYLGNENAQYLSNNHLVLLLWYLVLIIDYNFFI